MAFVSGERRGPPLSPRDVAKVAMLPLLALWFWQFHGRSIDDAYITLSYARSVAENQVWGMHPQLLSNSATSPLGVLTLAALIALRIPPEAAIWVLNLFLSGLALWSLGVLHSSLHPRAAWYAPTLTLLLLVTNPLLVSTLGLETYLSITLFLAAIALIVRGKLTGAAVVSSLLVLTRPDGLIPEAILLAEITRRGGSGRLWRLLIALLLPSLWFLWSWLVLGSLLPDTILIKKFQASWGSFDYLRGPLLYLRRYGPATMLALLPLSLVLLLPPGLLRSAQARTLLILGGIPPVLIFALYAVAEVPPYHWYYGFSLAAGIALVSLLSLHGDRLRIRLVAWVHCLIIMASIAFTLSYLHSRDVVPIQSNWGTVAEYRQIARDINQIQPQGSFVLDGELGVIQYFTTANALNEFSDRKLLQATSGTGKGPMVQRLLSWNKAHFKAPAIDRPGHRLRARQGSCELPNERLVKKWRTTNPWVDRQVQWCLIRLEQGAGEADQPKRPLT
jgi:hypothetical protein